MAKQVLKIVSKQKSCNHTILPVQTVFIVSYEVLFPSCFIFWLPRLFNYTCYLTQGSMLLERVEQKTIKIKMNFSEAFRLQSLIHLYLIKEYPYTLFRLRHCLPFVNCKHSTHHKSLIILSWRLTWDALKQKGQLHNKCAELGAELGWRSYRLFRLD